MDRLFALIRLAVFFLSYILPWGLGVLTITASMLKTDRQKKNKFLALLVSVMTAAYAVAFLLIQRVFLKRFNVLYTLKNVYLKKFTYDEVEMWAYSLVACTFLVFIIAYLMRLVFSKIFKNMYIVVWPGRESGLKILIGLSVMVLFVVVILSNCFLAPSGIKINVVCTGANLEGEPDSKKQYVELYNTSNLDITLSTLYLSTNEDELKMYAIKPKTIKSKESKRLEVDRNELKIKSKGEQTLILSDAKGTILDKVETLQMSEAKEAYANVNGWNSTIVYIRTDADAGFLDDVLKPLWSDGKNDTKPIIISAPVLSHKAGFYDEEFNLTIKAPSADTEVYYTLDGSKPSNKSTLYCEAIHVYDPSANPNVIKNIGNAVTGYTDKTLETEPVDKAFIVRAVSVDRLGNESPVVTATYFVNKPQYEGGKIVSIVADPEEFFGDDGIYVTGSDYDEWLNDGEDEDDAPTPNFRQRGKEYEIPASLEVIADDVILSQNVGLRVSGGSSRNKKIKSFGFYARKEYSGSNVFDVQLFEGINSHKLGTRGGYINSVGQLLARGRDLSLQGMQRVALFVNGEFYCNTNLTEKYDARYFAEHYGLAKDDVIVCQAGELVDGEKDDKSLYKEIKKFSSNHDMTDEASFEEFCKIADIQSYIDMMCFRTYIDDLDYTETKNTVLWRSRKAGSSEYGDGKWRWCLYDLDAMEWNDYDLYGVSSQAEKNSFSLVPRYTQGMAINTQSLYAGLKNSEEFRKLYVNTFMDMRNSIFTMESVEAAIKEYGEDTPDYQSGNKSKPALSYYYDFFRERPKYIVPYMAEEFELTGSLETINISVNDSSMGQVKINTICADFTNGAWSGEYYTDYPVTLVAKPMPGYVFVGWEGDVKSKDESIEVTLKEGGSDLHAVFKRK
ncbi:MAG: CotH kinase family protein [Lachnospiraceae bacterium]|nr:CotH kinase family protein [Lachnospiraceae bacterium]